MGGDGIFNEDPNGNTVAISRDVFGPKNNLNLVWMEKGVWDANCVIEAGIGSLNLPDDGEQTSITTSWTRVMFNVGTLDVPDAVSI